MVTLKVQKENQFQENYFTTNILECVKYWNREGETVIQKNIDGIWGNETTQEMASTMQADDFLLEMILTDCKTYCNGANNPTHNEHIPNLKWECGRTRSHVWVHINDERVLMIHT